MKVQQQGIDEVKPYTNNAKLHPDFQVDKIASSISQFGWDQPIVVDEDFVILKGHGRYFAAQKLGLSAVPLIVREDLTEEQKKAARIADNKSAESDWDLDALKIEMEDLQELNVELDITGFESGEIESLLDTQESGGQGAPPGNDGQGTAPGTGEQRPAQGTGEQLFAPKLDPEPKKEGEVTTQHDINAAQEKLNNQYSEAAKKEYVAVMCPSCGEEFNIEK